jgi:HAD superfamily hydrolase (TIGR01490 family)
VTAKATGGAPSEGTRAAAFFDLDHTVIATSSALAFGRPFYRGGLISRADVLRATYARLVFRWGGADQTQMDRTRDYIAELCRGWDVEQVRQIVAETLHDIVQPSVYAEATALIADHHEAGRDVVIVSSSGEEMVRPIGAMLGVDEVVATKMMIADGKYTGEVGYYPAGPHKALAIREHAEAKGYHLPSCYAYSDSITDVPMLEAVGHPHAVNPDRGLRRVASERGWEILEFRRPVTLRPRIPAPSSQVLAGAAAGVGVAAVAGLLWYGYHRKATTGIRLGPSRPRLRKG